MAFGSRTLKFSGPSGKITSNGAEYRQVWHCTLTDALDGPVTIFNYFKANGPYIGDHYVNGNETDLASFLDEIDVPQHIDGSATEYSVVCTYRPISVSGGGAGNQGGGGRRSEVRRDRDTGTPTAEPTRWRSEISVSFLPQQTPVYLAEYVGGFTGNTAISTPPGTMLMPTNSADTVFDPPLEKDDNRLTIRIKFYKKIFNVDEAKSTINRVNKFPVRFGRFKTLPTGALLEGIYGNFAEGTLKVSSIDGAPRIEHTADVEQEYYEINIEVQWRDAGWHEFVVDRGLSFAVKAGVANGRGGRFSADPEVNAAPHTPIQGIDGEPITEPTLLDGDGKTLKEGEPPVYLEYKLYTEIDFAEDPFLGTFFYPAVG